MKRKTFLCALFLTLSIGWMEASKIPKIRPPRKQPVAGTEIPQRAKGQTDVIELRCAPIDTVNIAIIGLGNRGISAVHRLGFIPTARIKVLCDVNPTYVKRAQQYLSDKKIAPADEYTGLSDWKKICQRNDIDLVYVCTQWDLHAPIAVAAMKNGKHVALEVPAALTIDQCWDLVDTAEKTRRHCMMLENCNYDFFEMATLNMVQQGLLGEIVHAEGAYIHDLRALNFSKDYYWNQWRLKANTTQTGCLYPTHGIGPVAHVMNIHRGDKMNYLTCVASNQFGMTLYAENRFGKDSKEARTDYKHGDMSTTLIKTQRGKTIMIQHDVTSPRPYSRLHTLSGTKGFVQKYPLEGISLDRMGHDFLTERQRDSLLQLYRHPIVEEVGELAKKVGGHGGMDFIMDYRLIYCLNKGLPLDQDVYDAAEWSSLIPLTQKSLEHNSMPVEIPDFTRGSWEKVNRVQYYRE